MSTLFKGSLVRLAAPQSDDFETMAQWSNDPEYLRLMDTDPARPINAKALEEFEQGFFKNPNSFGFRIRTLTDDKLIGFLHLDVMWNSQSSFLAIGIGERDYWGKGYGSDALRLILNYAFNELNQHRVGLNVTSYNTRAIRAYEKVGFKYEGAQREYSMRDGQRYDLVYYGILREEWIQQ